MKFYECLSIMQNNFTFNFYVTHSENLLKNPFYCENHCCCKDLYGCWVPCYYMYKRGEYSRYTVMSTFLNNLNFIGKTFQSNESPLNPSNLKLFLLLLLEKCHQKWPLLKLLLHCYIKLWMSVWAYATDRKQQNCI